MYKSFYSIVKTVLSKPGDERNVRRRSFLNKFIGILYLGHPCFAFSKMIKRKCLIFPILSSLLMTWKPYLYRKSIGKFKMTIFPSRCGLKVIKWCLIPKYSCNLLFRCNGSNLKLMGAVLRPANISKFKCLNGFFKYPTWKASRFASW